MIWWSQAGSNRRPLACHASALPAELWPQLSRGETLRSPPTAVNIMYPFGLRLHLETVDGVFRSFRVSARQLGHTSEHRFTIDNETIGKIEPHVTLEDH